MKKLLPAIFICFCLFSSAQKPTKTDDIYFTPKKQNVFSEIARQASEQTTDVKWIQANLAKYHKQRQTAFILFGASVVSSSVAVLIDKQNPNEILLGVGGFCSMGYLVTLVAAEKHLKNASLPPK